MIHPTLSDIFRLVTLGKTLLKSPRDAAQAWHGKERQPDGTQTMPGLQYPALMMNFVDEASRDCWIDPAYAPNETGRWINNHERVANASLTELRRMITYFVHGERLGDGHWAGMLQAGDIERLILRLQEFLPTMEYCAMRYLNMWLSEEARWLETMRGTDHSEKLKAMAKFAFRYVIARNFLLKYEQIEGTQVARFSPVLDAIDSLSPSDFAGANLLPKFTEVRDRISRAYGNRDVLSGTTKFLWLKVQHPIIIFDTQAREALGGKSGDIDDFYQRWRVGFECHQTEIIRACATLDRVRSYCVDPGAVTSRFMEQVASQIWFHERVFDIFLWTVGGQTALNHP